MSINALLKEAAKYSSVPNAALKLANLHLSDEDADSREKAIEMRAKWISRALSFMCIAIYSIALVWGGLSEFYSEIDHPHPLYIGVLSVLFVLMTMLLFALLRTFVSDQWANKTETQLLTPIAGTDRCETALVYLKHGGPLVAQWRDAALTRRSQLRVFDWQIMYALSQMHDQHALNISRQAKINAACQKVHGLASA